MGEALRRFYEVWRQATTTAGASHAAPVYCRGSVSGPMGELGMEVELGDPAARLEFLSPRRGGWSGFWLEELPRELGGESVQRLFAAAFLGLKPGSPLLVMFEHHEPTALLAWLRQAGFHALVQAQRPLESGAELRMILARRI